MPKAFTPEWGLDIQNQVPATSRPDFLLSKRDRLAELNSFTGRTKHPGSQRGYAHRHHHLQTELRQLSESQTAVQLESPVPPEIKGMETVDSPLMAAALFAVIGSGEWGKKNVSRLLAAILVLAGCTGVIRQESTPTPESPPAVTVVTNTPVFIDAPTATLAATATEAQTGAAGGAVFTADIGLKLEQLADANLPLPVCDQSGNQSADRELWESPQAADIEAGGGDIQNLYDLLRSKLPAGAQVRLCANSEGWYFRVTTADGVPVWNQIKVKGDDGQWQWRWAYHPNRIPVDEDGNIEDWRMMRLPGPFSDFEPLVIDGVPAEVQLDRDGRPTAYFDPLTGEWIFLKPEPTATPTRTATATPTITNTPRPTAIPATRVPTAIPTSTLEPSPTAVPQPEGFISTRGVLPSREELIGCATGVKLNPREVDAIDPMTGKPFHHYRNRVASNSGGVLTYEDGRMEDINRFAVPRIIQVIFDDPTNNNRWYDFDNAYAIADFAQLIKPGDVVAMDWEDGTPINILLFCNSR